MTISCTFPKLLSSAASRARCAAAFSRLLGDSCHLLAYAMVAGLLGACSTTILDLGSAPVEDASSGEPSDTAGGGERVAPAEDAAAVAADSSPRDAPSRPRADVADSSRGVSDAVEEIVESPCGSAGTCRPGNSCQLPCQFCFCDTNGAWQCLEQPCQPQCPAVRPREKEPCKELDLKCVYPSSCNSEDIFYCKDGLWSSSLAACSACPEVAPVNGAKCDAESLACQWQNTCASVTDGLCSAGVWRISPKCAGECPIAAPKDGEPCKPEGVSCEWSQSCGQLYGYCEGGVWVVKILSC